MKDTLISYETAILAKGRGFDSATELIYAATQSMLQKWLRNKNIFVNIDFEFIGSDEWVFVYKIRYLPEEFHEAKRRIPHFKMIESFTEYGGTYTGGWDTYEAALEEGLKKALELIKDNV